MKDLSGYSDEALAAEIARRERRKETAEHDRVLQEFVHYVCMSPNDGMHAVVVDEIRRSLGKSDYELFLASPEKFVFSITGSYVGSR